ncbi:MAG TPA: hypothetical protein VHP33_02200 [Polyangiaceae bacterium]|nr:hypothetical protein [Polyangiaceae bacterium]
MLKRYVRGLTLVPMGLFGLSAVNCATEADGAAVAEAGAGRAASSGGSAGTASGNPSASGSPSLPSGGAVGIGGASSGGVGGAGGGASIGNGGASPTGGAHAAAGAAGNSGAAGTGMPGMTLDLVAVTHADGWIPGFDVNAAVISSPMVIGAWFDYQYPAAPSCGMTLNKAKPICFAGKGCPGATGALGFSTCALNGLDVSKWPQMQAFVASRNLSTATGSSFAFSACNPGLKITGVNWKGNLPSGVVVGFHDAADKTLGTAPIPAGAASIAVPPSIDGTKIASIHFLVDGTAVPSWSFCLTELKLSFQ